MWDYCFFDEQINNLLNDNGFIIKAKEWGGTQMKNAKKIKNNKFAAVVGAIIGALFISLIFLVPGLVVWQKVFIIILGMIIAGFSAFSIAKIR